MIEDNKWWRDAAERAERTTARQIGVHRSYLKAGVPIAEVRAAVAKMMAPKASDAGMPHRSASVRCALMLAASNKRRAELGQPLIPLD